jgi:hypothetical protein
VREAEVARLEGSEPEGGVGDRGDLRLALAGNHDISPIRVASAIYARIRALPSGSIILLRRPRNPSIPAGTFELIAARIAQDRGLEVEWFEPEPGGREQVYRRDFELVGAADRVEAFFSSNEMNGGTGHVVEAALSKGIPVFAWCVAERGALERIGEWEYDE